MFRASVVFLRKRTHFHKDLLSKVIDLLNRTHLFSIGFQRGFKKRAVYSGAWLFLKKSWFAQWFSHILMRNKSVAFKWKT